MPLYRRPRSPFWWVRLGRKVRRSTGTADRAQAQEFERVLAERLWRRDKLGDRSALPWNKATDRWLTDSKRARKRDREFIAFLKPKIGEEMVSAIADADVIERLRQIGLAEGWAHSTVDRMMRTVRAILRACVRWRHLEVVPHIPMYGEAESEPRFLSHAEFRRLCRELPPHLQRAARFAVMTLLRKSAQSQLEWDRLDLKAHQGWVRPTQMKGGKGFDFPLSPEAEQVLKECRRVSKGPRVFQYEGRPIANFNTEAFRKAATRAGLQGLRWHDLRHTGASWAVQGGVTLPALMVLGGWKSYRMVLVYARFAPSHAASAAAKVGHQVAHALRRARRPK